MFDTRVNRHAAHAIPKLFHDLLKDEHLHSFHQLRVHLRRLHRAQRRVSQRSVLSNCRMFLNIQWCFSLKNHFHRRDHTAGSICPHWGQFDTTEVIWTLSRHSRVDAWRLLN
jgi:hypothetical protein